MLRSPGQEVDEIGRFEIEETLCWLIGICGEERAIRRARSGRCGGGRGGEGDWSMGTVSEAGMRFVFIFNYVLFCIGRSEEEHRGLFGSQVNNDYSS